MSHRGTAVSEGTTGTEGTLRVDGAPSANAVGRHDEPTKA